MSGTGIKLRQRVVVFSKGCLKWACSHVNDRSIYNHANNWMSNSFIRLRQNALQLVAGMNGETNLGEARQSEDG